MADKHRYSQDKSRLHEQYMNSELTKDELAGMERLLEGVDAWSQSELKPGTHVKEALMAEMAKSRHKKGVVWLNGVWAWLMPQGRSFHRTPLFQLGLTVACVVLVVFAVNLMDGSDSAKKDSVAISEEEPVVVEKKSEVVEQKTKESEESIEVSAAESGAESTGFSNEKPAPVDQDEKFSSTEEVRAQDVPADEVERVFFKVDNSKLSSDVDKVADRSSLKSVDYSLKDQERAPAPPEGYSNGSIATTDGLTFDDAEIREEVSEVNSLTETKSLYKSDEFSNQEVPANTETGNIEVLMQGGFTQTVTNGTTITATQQTDVSLNTYGNAQVYKEKKGRASSSKAKKNASMSLAQSDSEDLIDLLYTAE